MGHLQCRLVWTVVRYTKQELEDIVVLSSMPAVCVMYVACRVHTGLQTSSGVRVMRERETAAAMLAGCASADWG